MNIFILSEDPVLAAQQQCDQHIVKMPLESAQMLSTVHRLLDGVETKRPSKSGKRILPYWELSGDLEDLVYKVAHAKHPCTIWSMLSSENYDWHYKHFVALCEEFELRYGKPHMSYTKLAEFLKNKPTNIPKGKMTPFVQAMFDDCKGPDAVTAYQSFYNKYKRKFATWNRGRQQPTWWK